MNLVVVDENDTPIGVKSRGDLTENDIYRVARLLIINADKQLLMAQRAFVKEKDPGAWGLAVEGTVEEGETYESNIRKEAQEEIGTTLSKLELGPKLRITGKYNYWSQFFVCYADLDANSLILQEDEVAAVKWFSLEELQQDLASRPTTFGYQFGLMLAQAEPYLARH